MPFEVDDQVVYPAFGIGRIVGLVPKTFFEAETQMYYEVSGDRSTVWVQVDEGSARGLRRLTRQDELAHYRDVLRGQPVALNQDHRQRQMDLRSQLKQGTLQSVCEMVRDLSARAWAKPLTETDSLALRRSRDALCQEWAAADGVSVSEATTELTALLSEARKNFQPQPAVKAT
jgi:RNA polymerase-interacting CarD/CdnL/TRCF family regulator